MAPASTEDQFKFLISCIRYSSNGKVDFVEVAKECDIVSKGAAAKRYERLMKAHGIHQSQSDVRQTSISPLKPLKDKDTKERKEPKSAAAKKRKADLFNDAVNNATDDDEDFEGAAPVKQEKGNKRIKNEGFKAEGVKEEATKNELGFQTDGAGDIYQYPLATETVAPKQENLVELSDYLEPAALQGHGKEIQYPLRPSFEHSGFGGFGLPSSSVGEWNGRAPNETIFIAD